MREVTAALQAATGFDLATAAARHRRLLDPDLRDSAAPPGARLRPRRHRRRPGRRPRRGGAAPARGGRPPSVHGRRHRPLRHPGDGAPRRARLLQGRRRGRVLRRLPERGLGVAIKIDDGNNARAAEVAMAAAIEAFVPLDDGEAALLRSLSDVTLSNWNGIEVGALRATHALRRAATGDARDDSGTSGASRRHTRGRDALDTAARGRRRKPYRADTLVAFVNSAESLHAMSSRSVAPHSRRLVNLIGEVCQALPDRLCVKPQKWSLPWRRRWKRWKARLGGRGAGRSADARLLPDGQTIASASIGKPPPPASSAPGVGDPCCSASSASSACRVSASCSGLSCADAQHAREAHRDAALVAGAAVDALEAELEHQRRPHAAHRAELLERGPADDRVDAAELLVGQARVGLGEGHQLQRVRVPAAPCGRSPRAPPRPRRRRAACGSRPRRCSRCRRWRGGRGRPGRRPARSRRSAGRSSTSTRCRRQVVLLAPAGAVARRRGA